MSRKPLYESHLLHRALVAAGFLIVLLSGVQLPFSIYLLNNKPGLTYGRVPGRSSIKQGLVIQRLPFGGESDESPLRDGDIVTAMNGEKKDSASFDEMQHIKQVASFEIGDTIRFDLLRDGKPLTVYDVLEKSRAEVAGTTEALTLYLYNTVAPLITTLIGLILLIRRPRTRQTVIFFLLTLTISFYLLASTPLYMYIPWWWELLPTLGYIVNISVYLFFALMLHFLLVFPVERRLFRSTTVRNVVVYSFFLAVYGVVLLTHIGVIRGAFIENRGLDFTIMILMGAVPFLGLVFLIRSYRKTTSVHIRKVIRIIFIGIATFGLASALLMVTPWIYDAIPTGVFITLRIVLLLLLTFSLPIAFGYALFKYGFLDVRIVFKQTAVYTLVGGTLVAGYTLIFLFFESFGKSYSRIDAMFLSLVFAGVLLLLLVVLKDRVQAIVGRLFFREEARASRELRRFAKGLLGYLNRDSILKAMTNDLSAILKLRGASVCLAYDSGEASPLYGAETCEDGLHDLLKHPAVLAALADVQMFLPSEIQGGEFASSIGALCPLASQNGEHVVVVLREKTSGKPFSDEELFQLYNVADHAALAWRNAGLTEEMKANERIMKEVEIAQKIQTAMMPRATPSIPGLDLAAVYMPANEMGGDFYDLIPLERDRLAVVVGDVSDKGVSAAMVMASAISTIRFAAELQVSPRDILARSNNRLYLDTRKHMFVAVFLGILDINTREITFTNAGLPKPLLVRDSEAFLLDWSDNGEHLPLGVHYNLEYHEQSLSLQPGDILLLYSDGLVECANTDQEEFGIKRIKNILIESTGKSAQDILSTITQELHAFSYPSELTDDITAVVVKMEESAESGVRS